MSGLRSCVNHSDDSFETLSFFENACLAVLQRNKPRTPNSLPYPQYLATFSLIPRRMKKTHIFFFWPAAFYLLNDGANISAYAKKRGKSTTTRDAHTDQACAEFHEENSIGSGWVRSDCEAVWSKWASTLDGAEHRPLPIREIFKETTTALRLEGNPCLVDSFRYPDGVGSAAIRLLATWMFAEDMGCDWITPKSPRSTIDDTGTSLYCHPTVHVSGHEPKSLDRAQDPNNGGWRCEVTNWLAFFHYDTHGVKGDRNGTDETIYVRPNEITPVL